MKLRGGAEHTDTVSQKTVACGELKAVLLDKEPVQSGTFPALLKVFHISLVRYSPGAGMTEALERWS